MGRRKTKKAKAHGGGGGGKHHGPGPQGAAGKQADVQAEGGPEEVDMTQRQANDGAGGAAAAASSSQSQGTAQAVPPKQLPEKPRSSPRRTLSGGRAGMNSNKALQRAQIQGELSSLEAQLAAVEDLQARMAAKLSSVDTNIATMQDNVDEAAPAAGASAASVAPPKEENRDNAVEKAGSPEKEGKGKSKKNKKSKQDKALKQEENLKEAQQMKEAAVVSQKEEKVVGASQSECDVESWEDIEQVEVVLEGSADSREAAIKCLTKVSAGRVCEVKTPQPCENTDEEMREEKKLEDWRAQEDAIEKKIIAECNADKEIGDVLGKALSSEIVQYLMDDYQSMINLRLALDAECQFGLGVIDKTLLDGMSSSDELTPKKVGCYFSYADAVKSTLQKESEGQQERAEDLNVDGLYSEQKLSDLSQEEQTHVLQYMKTEYEPFLRRLEAEHGEAVYRAAESGAGAHVQPNARGPPRIEVSLAGTPPASSDDDDVRQEMNSKQKPSNEFNEEQHVREALAQDYHQISMVSSCLDAEIKYQEIIGNAGPKTSCCARVKQTEKDEPQLPSHPAECPEKAIAQCLKEDCQRMEAHVAALKQEEKYHSMSSSLDGDEHPATCSSADHDDEARHAEAARVAAVLEAATMEVEYEGAEEQFLMHREQQRARPWRWVRADTAPAHIDVPETVHEPTSEGEQEGSETRSIEVLTDMNGLVFQCQDTSTQTEPKYSECCDCEVTALPWDKQIPLRLQQEIAQRTALEKYIQALEQEGKEQRQRLADQRKIANQLENSISDKKAEASEAKMIAAEYKLRCNDLEHSLDTARSVVNTLEDQADTAHRMPSDIDYMLESKMNNLKTSEAQAKIDELETKLLLSKAEVQTLLDKLSDRNKQLEMMPVVVHQQQMQKVEGVCHELQLKVTQLESELAKVRNVRDVWGSSCQHGPAAIQSGGLDISFPPLGPAGSHVYEMPPSMLTKTTTASVDLPPVTGVDLPAVPDAGMPACLSGLALGHSPPAPPAMSASLTSGLLSGLSDLQDKAPPVVAPLAMQEDMDSDDDVSWSSASEHLRDASSASGQSRASPAPGTPLSNLRPTKACLPPNPLLGQLDCRSPVQGSAAGPCDPTLPAGPNHPPPAQPLQHQQQGNQNSASPKPKGNKRRHRPKKYQK